MSPTHTPLCFDWAIWTAIVAALAFILTQLPPLHRVLFRDRPKLDVRSRISVTLKVRIAQVAAHLTLANTGGRSVTVMRVAWDLRRNHAPLAPLPGSIS